MSKRILPGFVCLALATGILAGCGSTQTRNPDQQVSQGMMSQDLGAQKPAPKGGGELGAAANGFESGPPELGPTSLPPSADVGNEGDGANPASETLQLVIKQAEIRLLVKDTDNAIDRLTQAAADAGGYIISNRVWFETAEGENYKYATYTIRVPADQFENTLRRLRSLAVRVQDETASGQDVTDEYVDLESQLRNLQATQERIREFLAKAQTVEEALRVNDQLAAVEAQIEKVQGRMRYLSDRAAFSSIAINLNPEIPEVTPTPTSPPTPTPTPTQTPTSEPWSPGHTFEGASHVLITILQGLVEAGIWIGIVVLPLAIPWIILFLIVRRFFRK
jgi:hypothetical protein